MFVEVRVKVNLDGGSLVSWLLSHGVGIHSVYVVSCVVHNNDLRVPGLCSGSYISPDVFGSNFSISGHEMVLEAGFVVIVSFPYHTFNLRVGVSIFPVGIIINLQLSG